MKRTEPNKRDKEKCIRSKRFVILWCFLIEYRANRDKARDSKRDRLQPFYPATYQRVSVLRWNVPGQVEGQDKGQTIRKRNTNQLTKQPTTNQRATGLPAPK